MKVQWFSVLSVAGIIFLSGNSFSGELQWKKPLNDRAVVPSVAHIPTVITTDDTLDVPAITQVQQVGPVIPSRITPPAAPQVDRESLEMQNPITVPGMPRGITPDSPYIPPTERQLVPCTDNPLGLKSIREITHDIRPTLEGPLPMECALESEPYYGRHFDQSCFMWKASALSTQAAYFEDVQLERHGHTIVHPAFQPIVSGAKFFATIPMLPYKMGVTPPGECVYTLGHYRSGSCAPYMVEPCPISLRGALFEAGVVTGTVLAIP